MRAWPGSIALLIIAGAAASGYTSQQQPPPQTPTFTTGTDFVSTDVYVRDGAGRFIPGLTPRDFQVFEDGVRQTIASFAAIVGGRIITEVAPRAAAGEGLILPAQPPAAAQGRIFIIFIDDLHLQPSDTAQAKQVLRAIRDTVLHENDLVGIVSSGYSSIASDLSPDPEHLRLNRAIDKTQGSGMNARDIIQAAQTANGPAGLRFNAFVAFKTVYEILSQAEKVTNRRKAIFYVSSGYDFNPLTDSRAKALGVAAGDEVRNLFLTGGQQFADADLNAALGELVARARRANVAFYPVDPRGLVAGPDISAGLSPGEAARWVNKTLSTLRVIADETGGRCICGTNDFRRGLQIADNDMSDYYVIGYESTNPDTRRRTRYIEIKVTHPGAQKPIYKEWYTIKRREP